jgi:RNA polymerase sigma factor (sigma-70 family)
VSALASAHPLHSPPVETTRRLYEHHHGRIFGYCLSLLGSREEAEDAVQTTFMNAQRGLERGVTPEFELAWLFKIARNVCNNRHASASRRRRVESVSDFDALQDVLATPERGGPVSIGELTGALGSVPERQRRALLLREFRGFSYEEIAADLGVSVAAVETLIFRGRRAVAEQLGRKEAAGLRSTLASILTLFGRLFQGGAGTLKLAAVTAGIATTTTLVVVPAVRDHGGKTVPVAPRVSTTPPKVGNVAGGVGRNQARPAVRSAVDSPKPALAAAPPVVRTDASDNASSAPAPPATHVVGGAPLNGAPTTPSVPPLSVPSLSAPPISVPPISVPPVTVPEISLPSADLPRVELPVGAPSLPDVPKLP